MESTNLTKRALRLAAMFALFIAGLSFVSCASEDGEDQEASPIIGIWMSQASSTGTYYEVYDDQGGYYITNDINKSGNERETGTYRFSNNTLTCNPRGGTQKVYTCRFQGDRLTMTPTGDGGVKQFIRYQNTRVRRK